MSQQEQKIITLDDLALLINKQFDEQQKKLDERFTLLINKQFDEQQKKLDEINTKFDKQQKKLEKIEEKLNLVSEEIGQVFEITARHRIEKQFGRDFARPFCVKNLYGMARLSCPKDQDEPERDAEVQLGNTMKLVEFVTERNLEEFASLKILDEDKTLPLLDFKIIESKQSLVDYLNGLDNKRVKNDKDLAVKILEKISSLQKDLNKTAKKEKDAIKKKIQRLELLRKYCLADENTKKSMIKGPLGLLFFLSPFNGTSTFEIEIDCRGISKKTAKNSYHYEVGEIKKSSKNVADGKLQLKERLFYIVFAARVIYGFEISSSHKAHIFIGNNYTTTSQLNDEDTEYLSIHLLS